MADYVVYILLAIWAIGIVLFFSHEVWVYYKHPMEWERRHDGFNVMPDWQVWLIMVFWPIVLVAVILYTGWCELMREDK